MHERIRHVLIDGYLNYLRLGRAALMGRARLTATGASVKILQTHLRQLTHTIMVIQRKPGGNPEVKNSEYEQ